MELPALPRLPKVTERYDEEHDEVEEKYVRTIVDRTKFGIRDAYPNFIITELQVFYYQSMYDQIKDNGTVVTSVDTYGLGMLAFNMALVDDCNYSIANKGMNMEYQGDRKMVLKRNPALDVLKDAQAAVRFYLKEFKMTPTSRGNVLSVSNNSDDGFDEV
jgi:hypothetical protein|tara:strand:+ start:46 stop:525 length:480 start_codon:yes stop_codon:yes gene_type:complete